MPEEQELQKLEEYREEVLREVQARSDRLRGVEQRIEHQERLLEEIQSSGKQGGAIGTRNILAIEAVRKKIVRELEGLRSERREAVDDLTRAQERIHLVDDEIAQLASEVDSSTEVIVSDDGRERSD